MTLRTYSEMIKLETFDERLDYLRLWGAPHTSPRATSLAFFKSKEWLATRDMIITRDCGFDLGVLEPTSTVRSMSITSIQLTRMTFQNGVKSSSTPRT